MALLFMDGFAGNDLNHKWDPNSNPQGYTSGSSSGARVTGGYYFGTGGQTSPIYKSLTASNKMIVGFGMLTSSNMGITFYGDTGATSHITVVRDTSTGHLFIQRGATTVATGTTNIVPNTWWYVEVSVTISDTVGEVHVRLNGSTTDEVSFVGDTKNGGTNTTVDKIAFSLPAGCRVADVYVNNDTGSAPYNDFLGDVTVRTLIPNGNGTYSQLVGSDADSVNNYLLVDDLPYSGTDYVGSATTGNKDTYAITDLPTGVSTVYAVQIAGMMAKSDTSLGQARYVVRSGGTDYGGTTRALTTSYIGYYDLYTTDPATGVAWTTSGVNNMETGMEVM